MYEQRFGLKRRPFPATPDDSLYYPATGHELALASLSRALHDEQGIALLSGPPGAGKTLLGYLLCERLKDNAVCAFLPNSHLANRTALLQAILYDLSLPHEEGSEQVLRLRLTDHVLKNTAAGKPTVVVVDEAHHLDADLLEELRLLGNLEAGGRKALQVILLALPEIQDTLTRPELAAFSQRLVVRCELGPLGVEEALDYLLHHLRQAGGRPEKIAEEAALEVLARGARGIPRLLNQAGHQALVVADAAEVNQVDAEVALEALALLGLQAEDESSGEERLRLSEELRRSA